MQPFVQQCGIYPEHPLSAAKVPRCCFQCAQGQQLMVVTEKKLQVPYKKGKSRCQELKKDNFQTAGKLVRTRIRTFTGSVESATYNSVAAGVNAALTDSLSELCRIPPSAAPMCTNDVLKTQRMLNTEMKKF